MRVITINLNGIRSAATKGFFDWMLKQDADVICMQETKAQKHQLSSDVFQPEGYHAYFFDAEKKGYSGVALYLRHKPDRIMTGLGWDCADKEGRYIQADYANFSVASLYMPSASSGPERQNIKFDFLVHYQKQLADLRRKKREYIICGDWNIAHKNIDLKNWRGNQKNSGFLPEERAWMDHVLDELGYVDAFRILNQSPDQYTWWSNRGQSWAKNVGWRIDYQIITPGLKDTLKSTSIYTEQRFSDHAPLSVDYDIAGTEF
jgi:exodeoxyribonuclease-3